MLVDGQQRMTTIFEYFKRSANLKLPPSVPHYIHLKDNEKRDFLEYKVVVRDLGPLPQDRVVEIFQRINSTSYSLNAIEIANARYDNDLKDLAEDISLQPFWDDHSVFKTNEIKRMLDINFILVLITTLMSDYYNRDDRVEEFLKRYNDGFPDRASLRGQVVSTLGLIDDFRLAPSNRAWQRADLFTLLVETHRLSFKQDARLNPSLAGPVLQAFYERVDAIKNRHDPQAKLEIGTIMDLPVNEQDLVSYYRATLQGSNDRKNRIQRGMILSKVLALASVG